MDGKDLYFRPEPKQNAKYIRVWNIKTAKEKLGSRICSKLLFIHAIAGCDSTFRLYGIGEAAPLSKIQCSDEFNRISEVFMKDNAKENISSMLEKLHWSFCTMVILGMTWMPCATNCFLRKGNEEFQVC